MKLIVFDMDDTLLHDDLSISDYTCDVLSTLHEKGFCIVPASGRAQKSILPFVKKLGFVDYYISCNGAEVWNGQDNSLINRESFSTETGKKIAAFGKKHQCYEQTYEGDFFYYSEESSWAEMYAKASMLKGICVGDLEAYINEPRSKILMMAEDTKIAAMLTEARSLFAGEASVTCSKPYFLEFNPIKATKGLALSKVCEITGIPLSECIAFGDSLNDLSMLTAAGTGVAMGNAREDVISQCTHCCGTNNNDGVAHFLADMFLQGE